MTRLTTSSLTEVLRAADPLDAETAADLTTARTILDTRLDGVPTAKPIKTPSRWRVRSAAIAAGAAALTVTAIVAVPHFTKTSSGGLLGTAQASESGLTCGEGYATPIPPRSADPRLWPAWLPERWRPTKVFARAERVTGWCTAPSLVAAATGPSGTIAGTVKLTGPLPKVDIEGPTKPDRIGTYRAVRFPHPEVRHVYTWVITDSTGASWYAEANGFTLARARTLLGAATLHNDGAVAWDSSKAPGVKVLHHRTGNPYPTTEDDQAWYIRISSPRGGLGELDVESGRYEAPVASRVTEGSRLESYDGHQMLVIDMGSHNNWVLADVSPGVVASIDAPASNDIRQVERMLASLTNLSPDDPRLTKLALHEKYGK